MLNTALFFVKDTGQSNDLYDDNHDHTIEITKEVNLCHHCSSQFMLLYMFCFCTYVRNLYLVCRPN